MKSVTSHNKVKRIVILIVVAMLLIVISVISIYLSKEKPGKVISYSDYLEENQEIFDQFEELFYLQNDNMQVVVDELLLIDEFNSVKVLNSKEYYMITYEEYPEGQSSNSSDYIVFNYNDRTFFSRKASKELLDKLNANSVLKDTLDKLKNSQIVTNIYIDIVNSSVTIYFGVPAEVTPFIPNNTGGEQYFVYCEWQDLEKYWNVKIENNWYMKKTEIMEE